MPEQFNSFSTEDNTASTCCEDYLILKASASIRGDRTGYTECTFAHPLLWALVMKVYLLCTQFLDLVHTILDGFCSHWPYYSLYVYLKLQSVHTSLDGFCHHWAYYSLYSKLENLASLELQSEILKRRNQDEKTLDGLRIRVI